MKCSGCRDTRKGIKPCGRLVKSDKFDAFCSDLHRKDALTFAGEDAYNRHVQHFKAVAQTGDKSMFKVFNDTARPMFVSMLEAQKVKLQDTYINTVCAEYAQGVKNAWSSVGSSSARASQIVADFAEVRERRIASGKRKSYEGIACLLFGNDPTVSYALLKDEPNDSYTGKKSRTGSHASDLQSLGYSVDEPDEPTAVDPTKVPFPDDDDADLMSE